MSLTKTACGLLIIASVFTSISSVSAADTVLLKKGDVVVTKLDLERYIEERIPPENRFEALRRPNVVRDMLENIFVIRSIAEEARQYDVIDPEQLQWQLEFQGDRIRMAHLMERMLEQELRDVNWEQMAQEVYVADADKFITPERVNASHILIKVEGRSAEEAKSLAESVRQRALAGEDFSELATELSEDASVRRNRGNLGAFPRGRMAAAFEAAAFALTDPDQISDVVETEFGFHVIKLHEHLPEHKRSFESVSKEIEAELRQQLSNQIRQAKIMAVKSDEDVEVNIEAIEAVEAELIKSPSAS